MSLISRLETLRGSDAEAKRQLLDDLAAFLPEPALSAAEVAAIARGAASVLIDPAEGSDLRARAATVLGRTPDGLALAALIRTLRGDDAPPGTPLPGEVRRACAHAFHTLWSAGTADHPTPGTDDLAASLRTAGFPWDDTRAPLDLDRL